MGCPSRWLPFYKIGGSSGTPAVPLVARPRSGIASMRAIGVEAVGGDPGRRACFSRSDPERKAVEAPAAHRPSRISRLPSRRRGGLNNRERTGIPRTLGAPHPTAVVPKSASGWMNGFNASFVLRQVHDRALILGRRVSRRVQGRGALMPAGTALRECESNSSGAVLARSKEPTLSGLRHGVAARGRANSVRRHEAARLNVRLPTAYPPFA
jgi:hypothetical protein